MAMNGNEKRTKKKETKRARYWRRMISAWERSELTQTAFCQEHDLSRSAFSWWKRELQRRTKNDPKKERRTTKGSPRHAERVLPRTGRRATERPGGSMPTFVPVQVKEHRSSDFPGERIEVILCNGCRLQVPHNVEPAVLRRLLEILR